MLAIDNSPRPVVPASENNRVDPININQPSLNSRISSLASSVQSLALRIIQGLREFVAKVIDAFRNCFAANHSVQNPAPIELVVVEENPAVGLAGNEGGQPIVVANPPVQNQEQNLADVLPFVEADYEEGASVVPNEDAVANAQADELIEAAIPNSDDEFELEEEIPHRSYASVVAKPSYAAKAAPGYGSAEIRYTPKVSK